LIFFAGITLLMIYTGYFAKLKKYAQCGLQLVSIANVHPSISYGARMAEFKLLVPSKWIYPWKKSLKNRTDLDRAKIEYAEAYYAECLYNFTPEKLFNYLNIFNSRRDTVLLCYEKPPEQMGSDGIVNLDWLKAGSSFCHRHLVSDFLRRGGFDCREFIVPDSIPGRDLFE
jgi:hypothetical protein